MRANIEGALLRNVVQEGAVLYKGEILAISANQTIAAGAPYALAFDPASTGRNVVMYTPTVPSLWTEHDVFNISAGTGALTIQQPDAATTVIVVQPGQRAMLFWNPKSQLWEGYPLTKGITNTVGSQVTFQQYTTLAALANAQVFAMTVPFAFKLNSIGFRTRVVASTAAKAATLTGQVNGVSVTGGVVSLTTANQNTSGGLTAGTSITAGNVGTAGQSVGAVVSGVTAFVEGDGYVEYNITNTSINA